MTQTKPTNPSLLRHAILNLSKFHREHEKFYASHPARWPCTCSATYAPCRHLSFPRDQAEIIG